MTSTTNFAEHFDANLISWPGASPRIFLGSSDAAHCSIQTLRRLRITHILVAGIGLEQPHKESDIKHLKLKLIDLPMQTLTPSLTPACEFIASVAEGDAVLVHCARGVSRSASIVIAYVSRCLHCSYEEAIAIVRKARQCIMPNFGFEGELRMWCRDQQVCAPPPAPAPAILDVDVVVVATSPPRSPPRSPPPLPSEQ
jgi:hypothetical protein